MIVRFILSVLAIYLYGWFNARMGNVATLESGKIASLQFSNNDGAYLAAMAGLDFFKGFGVPLIVLVAALIAIWWKPVRKLIASVMLVGVLFMPQHADAYYDQKDYTEAYTILPNESAFWIPDVGDNKSSQAQMQSEEYLNANKVALKRFIVPHTKLSGTGAFWDFYVPAGRLIIVDRTPYSREWVDAHDRGTSRKKEGFPCQSKEGLNITAGVSIGVSVTEADAAKFLYRFGVKAWPGDRGDPKIIFASYYLGRSLTDVMDDVGRKKVQSLVCDEIYQRTFDKANEEATIIMANVEKKARAYFATVGITLDFIGWGDTFNFDDVVQNAVNRRFVASQEAAAAQLLQPYVGIIQTLANADALRAFTNRTDGRLPTTMVGNPADMSMLLGGMFGTVPKPAAPPKQ